MVILIRIIGGVVYISLDYLDLIWCVLVVVVFVLLGVGISWNKFFINQLIIVFTDCTWMHCCGVALLIAAFLFQF